MHIGQNIILIFLRYKRSKCPMDFFNVSKNQNNGQVSRDSCAQLQLSVGFKTVKFSQIKPACHHNEYSLPLDLIDLTRGIIWTDSTFPVPRQ